MLKMLTVPCRRHACQREFFVWRCRKKMLGPPEILREVSSPARAGGPGFTRTALVAGIRRMHVCQTLASFCALF